MGGQVPGAGVVRLRLTLTAAAAVPACVVRFSGAQVGPVWGGLVYGLGVLAAALLLMWAAETARADISGALALALLALIAVLPEYAVDLYFAYAAGKTRERVLAVEVAQ